MGRPRASTIDVATPERLLAAAEAEFAQRGLTGANLADIAGRAGISRPALLYHFATKEKLYEAVVGRAFSSLAEILASAMSASGTFEERLRAVVESFQTFVNVHPALARIMVREMINEDGPGRALLLTLGAPLLDDVVTFMEREGRTHLRPGLPVRAALMSTVADTLLRTACVADVRHALWGDGEHGREIADTLFLRSSSSTSSSTPSSWEHS